MRFLPLLALLSLLPSVSHASQRVLDCNFNFGDVEEIDIRRDANASLSFLLLANGTWTQPTAISDADWRAHDLSFPFKSERYHFSSRDGRHWEYEIYSAGATSPNTVGTADCD